MGGLAGFYAKSEQDTPTLCIIAVHPQATISGEVMTFFVFAFLLGVFLIYVAWRAFGF